MKKERHTRSRKHKLLYRTVILVFYLFVLAYLSGFALHMMFELRGVAAVVLGTCLFSVPLLLEAHKTDAESYFWNRIAEHAVLSGCLTASLFTLAHLSENQSDAVTHITRQLGVDLRPILYGLCIYTVLQTAEEPLEEAACSERQPQEMQKEAERNLDELYLFYQKAGLTNRETELAILAYRGYSNRDIARECYISEATVKKHMTDIFEKLQVAGREELRTFSNESQNIQLEK